MRRGERIRRGSRSRRGFTLLELVIALVLSAGLMLAARQLTETLGTGASRIAAAGVRDDGEANAERLLRSLVEQIEVGTGEGMSFEGTEEVARFSSWCAVPEGWREHCGVVLSIVPADGELVLVLNRDGGAWLPVIRADSVLALRYLANASGGGTWFERWGAGTSTPLAIGLIQDADTLVFRIGDRG